MLKVTLKFTVYCALLLFCACSGGEREPDQLELQRLNDAASEARIDSAYAAIRGNCDTLMLYRAPQLADSVLRDSALLQVFFDSTPVYQDADKKVEKVVRQLQADCDSSLQKETYRIARSRQRSKPVPQKKLKA